VTAEISLESVPCPFCHRPDQTPILTANDPQARIPGSFQVVECSSCRFAYLNPRVPHDLLLTRSPEGFGPALTRVAARSAFHGGRLLSGATTWALARYLDYRHLEGAPPGLPVRCLARLRRRRLASKYPRFLGRGRLLDVGCWTGGFLQSMAELGWESAGIELIPEAGAIAREVTPNIFVGDLMHAPFADASFDLVTAFHIVEHLPDPFESLQRIIRWVAPAGRAIIEVPNFSGIGRRIFRRYWHGLDLPFHHSHFTPRTLQRFIESAGARVVQIEQRSDPHAMIRSLENLIRARGGHRAMGLVQSSIVKRLLSLSLGFFNRIGLGEAIRVTVAPVYRQTGGSAQAVQKGPDARRRGSQE